MLSQLSENARPTMIYRKRAAGEDVKKCGGEVSVLEKRQELRDPRSKGTEKGQKSKLKKKAVFNLFTTPHDIDFPKADILRTGNRCLTIKQLKQCTTAVTGVQADYHKAEIERRE